MQRRLMNNIYNQSEIQKMEHIIFVLTLLFVSLDIVSSACTSPKPYDWNGGCFEECPWDPPDVTYLIDATNTCVANCPSPNLFADDNSKTCVSDCPEDPILTYFDHNQQKCVQTCSSNPSQFALQTNRSCVSQCPSPYYADESNRICVQECPTGMFYQVVGTLRICTDRCYPNYYANVDEVCVVATACPSSPVKFYGDDLSGLCVEECPEGADTFAEQTSRKCVHHCELGTFADSTTLRCVSECPSSPEYFGSNTTRQCHLQCIEGEFAYEDDRQCYSVCPSGYGDYESRKCVDTCPQTNETFADDETKLCIEKCSPGKYADNETRKCVASVSCTGDFVGNPLTLQCIDAQSCPSGYYIDFTQKLCVKRCTAGQFANLDTRVCGTECEWNPPIYVTYKQSEQQLCVETCPNNPRTFSDNDTQSCVSKCPDGTFGDASTMDCVLSCPDGYYGESSTDLCVSTCTTNTSTLLFFYSVNTSCLTACPETTYADNTTMTCVEECPAGELFADEQNNLCVDDCPPGKYGDTHSGYCVNQCPQITKQYADDSVHLCVDVCPVDPDYFGEDLNDGSRKCVSECTNSDVYADPVTRTCVEKCDLTKGYYGDVATGSGRCVLSCSAGYGNPETGLCVGTCPQSPIQTFGSSLTDTCVNRCPNNTYGNLDTETCVEATSCPTGFYGDDSTNLCVSRCPPLQFTFGDPVTRKCVTHCQYNYYADNTTRMCATSCNATAKLFKDPSTKTCVKICPSSPDLYNDLANFECVATCPGLQYRYAYGPIRQCVDMCPSSPVFFADQQTRSCVTTCANQTFKFTNLTYRGCLSSCPLQVFNATTNVTLYQDNTTWTCVSVCPLGYFAFKHPTDDNIRKCVKDCQIVSGTYYFSDNVTRSCVTECPMKVHSTYSDRINMKCVSTCTREQFRDQVSKECVYNCTDPYFSDNTTYTCVKQCPDGTFAETINRTCATECPKDWFGYQKECLDECPTDTTPKVYADNTTWRCIPICTQFPDYYSDADNQECVKVCTNGKFANDDSRTCGTALECTNDTVADPLTWRCVQQCPKAPAMYYKQPGTNLCGTVCTDDLFAYNDTNECVQNCPDPYFGVNETVTNFICVEYCPTNQYKFINATISLRICVLNCPDGTYAYDPTMECIEQCPYGFYANSADNKCLQDCNPLFADETTNMCVTQCPDDWTADGNDFLCKEKCVYGEFEEGKVCSTGCSAGLFADNLTRKCVAQLECPSDPLTFADTTTKKCVFQCSANFYAYEGNRTCMAACPDGFYKETTLRVCINTCLEGQFADPDSLQCVTSCASSSYPYADPHTQTCVEECPEDPETYGLNSQCIEQCPVGKYAQNYTQTCVDICPNVSAIVLKKGYADNLTRRCIEVCPILSYAYETATHNLCENTCPDGLFASNLTKSCVTECPDGSFSHNDSDICISQCPVGEWGDDLTHQCADGCYNSDQYADNSTNKCVDECPSEPDLYGEKSSNSCVLACQANFYAHPIDRVCVDECLDPYFNDPSSGLCVLECPIHEVLFANLNTPRRCVSECDNASGVIEYADITSRTCVTQCPEDDHLLYGVNSTNKCQESCPANTYGDNDTRVCLDKCVFENPKFNWMDRLDNMCVELCPLGYFADNSTGFCELTCSVGTYADNSTRRCVEACPIDPNTFADFDSSGNPVCVYVCATGLYAAEDTRTCVSVCSTTPFYYFHSTQKMSCVKECLYPYFGETSSQNCVTECQDGFYGNYTTKLCEQCRTQCVTCSAYLQCLTCLSGFYLYEFECVTSCPSYPVLYYAHEQSAKCFKTCPQPFYGLKSTKKCTLSCPTSFYPDPTTRQCTACPTGCLTCTISGCQTCYTGYKYVATTLTCNQYCNSTHIYSFNNDCHTNCPDGSYLTSDLVTCLACSTDCETCVGTAGNCTKCNEKFYYLGSCLDACPDNFFVNANMSCISCSVVPSSCILPPLTYTIKPFTENYQTKAFVVFSRSVDMTLAEFTEEVRIYLNGVAVLSNQFKASVFNTTTFLVTFNNLTSLNENSLSIGFRPGFITDLFGNQLTINNLETTFDEQTGVNEEVVTTSDKVEGTASVLSWIFLAVLLLFFIKSGYPVLLSVEVAQLVYMHTFLYVDPLPYVELRFLEAIRYFHFRFFPRLFGANYVDPVYDAFLDDVSFLANSSPFIFLWALGLLAYGITYLLSSRSALKNKTVRKTAKSIIKHRMRYHLLHDIFWVTYLLAVFFTMQQFRWMNFKTSVDIANAIFAMVVLALYTILTVYIIKLGYKYKEAHNPLQQFSNKTVPRKLSFITPEPSSFPLQIPLRYLRKYIICFALVIPGLQAQIFLMLMTNFVFLCYYLCFMPAKDQITNYLNIFIECSYLVIEGLFFAYFKLQNKNVDEQYGFGLTLVIIESILLAGVFMWMLYRFALVISKTETWGYVYVKLTENKDPEFLKEEQRKRDLNFDFGSLENRSHDERTDDFNMSSKNLNLNIPTDYNRSANIFDKDTMVSGRRSKRRSSEKLLNLQSSSDDISRMNDSENAEADMKLMDMNMNQPKDRIKTPYGTGRKARLQINEQNDKASEGLDIDEVLVVDSYDNHQNAEETQKKKQERVIWDDIEFEDHEI